MDLNADYRVSGVYRSWVAGSGRETSKTMKRGVIVLRATLVSVFVWCLWNTAQAKAAAVEYLMVPSEAMGRDMPVAFLGGGPHMVVPLDAFDGAPDVSNWVTAGNAMSTLAGKGISVAAPASGAYSLCTNWEQDGSRQKQ